MWRLKGGVGNGMEFDTHANVSFFRGRIRIAGEFAHCSISPLDSADNSLLVASVD